MAVEIGGVRIVLSMNAGEFSRGAKQAASILGDLGSKIEAISDRINRASVLITTGMFAAQRFANAARGIFDVAAAFEKGMASVATLVDTSTESMGAMSKQVLEIGQRTPVSLGELTGALYDIRSAGIDAGSAMSVLENSAKLAVAGLGTTREATDVATSAINAFGLKGEEAAQVFDVIFKTVKSGKTTISGLAQGFGAVAGTVAQAGIKIDDFMASVAALTTTGLPAAQAYTQLRAAIAGLTRDTTETKALFEALGVKTFKQLVDQSGSAVVAFQRIVAAERGNDAELIKLLGSVEAYNAVIGLAGKQNKAYVDTLVSMRDGSNAMEEAFGKQRNTLSSTLQALRNNIEAVTTSIGQALSPTLEAIAKKIADVAKAFTELSPQTQELIAQMIAVVGVVAPSIIAFGFFANALASLGPVALAVVGAFGTLTGVVAAMIAATGPIGLFVAAAATASLAWYTFRDEIIAIWDAVVTYVSNRIDALTQRMQDFAQSLGTAFDLITSGEFKAAWESFGTSISVTASQVNEAAKSGLLLANTWQTATESILPAAASSFNDKFVVPVSTGLDSLTKLWDQHNQRALHFGQQTIKDIMDPTEKLIDQQWRLKDALDAGGLTAEQYGRAMQKASLVSLNSYAGMASGIANNLAQVFSKNKAVAIAAAIVNTAESVTKTLATYGATPWGFAAAAAAAAAGLAQIAAIRRTTESSGGGGGGSSASTSAASAAVNAPQTLVVQGINPSQMFTGDAVANLARQLLAFQKDGGQVVIA